MVKPPDIPGREPSAEARPTRGIAAFLEPAGACLDFLREQKKRIDAAHPGQPFASHPPHLTLCFGAYESPLEYSGELALALRGTPPIRLQCAGVHVFYSDRLAGGGDTVVVRVHRSAALAELQMRIAAVFANHRSPPDSSMPPPPLREVMVQSFARYGFPFVGEHWIPHLTIASLVFDDRARWIEDWSRRAADFRFDVHEVHFVSVAGDDHRRVLSIPLAGGSASQPN